MTLADTHVSLIAAEADAALMDGHFRGVPCDAFGSPAAEADAALMDGHGVRPVSQRDSTTPRRPTRP